LHPEEALSRPQAISFYTVKNAYVLRKEHQIGSLEPGKFADFIVLDRDILTCPVDEIKDTQVLSTWFNGKLVFERK
jgi:predicted amidohydrolase YtcJ